MPWSIDKQWAYLVSMQSTAKSSIVTRGILVWFLSMANSAGTTNFVVLCFDLFLWLWLFSAQPAQKAIDSSPSPNFPKHSLHSNSANSPQTMHCLGEFSSTLVISRYRLGIIRGYILNWAPKRGIWIIRHGGISRSLISEVRNDWSKSCCTLGNCRESSFSTNNW